MIAGFLLVIFVFALFALLQGKAAWPIFLLIVLGSLGLLALAG